MSTTFSIGLVVVMGMIGSWALGLVPGARLKRSRSRLPGDAKQVWAPMVPSPYLGSLMKIQTITQIQTLHQLGTERVASGGSGR